MDRPTCKTCPYYDAEAPTMVYPPPLSAQQAVTFPAYPIEVKGLCRRHPAGGGHKRPEEWCGEHPRYPEFITAWTNGEMASGGAATNAEEWRYHHGSTATALMKDFMAMGITGGPATQAVESSEPASDEPTEPRPRWVYGNPASVGTWIVLRPEPKGRLDVLGLVDPVQFDSCYKVLCSFGPIPPSIETLFGLISQIQNRLEKADKIIAAITAMVEEFKE